MPRNLRTYFDDPPYDIDKIESKYPGRSVRLIMHSDPSAGGVLEVSLAGVGTFSFQIQGRHVRLLLALHRALVADRGNNPLLRGFRKAAELAEDYYAKEEKAWAPSVDHIKGIRSDLTYLLWTNLPASVVKIPLIENRRLHGIRLLKELVIVVMGPNGRMN